MTLSPTWNVTFPPLQEVCGRTGRAPGTALVSIAHMPHSHQRVLAKKLGFLAFQRPRTPVQAADCRCIDTPSLAANCHGFYDLAGRSPFLPELSAGEYSWPPRRRNSRTVAPTSPCSTSTA